MKPRVAKYAFVSAMALLGPGCGYVGLEYAPSRTHDGADAEADTCSLWSSPCDDLDADVVFDAAMVASDAAPHDADSEDTGLDTATHPEDGSFGTDAAFPEDAASDAEFPDANAPDEDAALPRDASASDDAAGPCSDQDQDGVCDAQDVCPGHDDGLDSDGDARPDGCDACPLDPTRVAVDACGCHVTPLPAPSAHFRLDETHGGLARDARSARTGTLKHAAPAWTAGHIAGALAFDGKADRVDFGDLGAARTLSFWVDARSYGTESQHTGWLSPSAHYPGANPFSSPELAYAPDNKSATFSSLLTTTSHAWGNFNVQVPTAPTGIDVRLHVTSLLGLLSEAYIALTWNAGANWSAECGGASLLSLGGGVYECPQATTHHAFTEAELANGLLRARLRVNGLLNLGAGLDHIAVRVHYDHSGRALLQLRNGRALRFTASSTLSAEGFGTPPLIYVDGQRATTLPPGFHQVTLVFASSESLADFVLGHAQGVSSLFHGRLDDLRSYPAALSPAQVETLFTKPNCGL